MYYFTYIFNKKKGIEIMIKIKGISKKFNAKVVLDNIDCIFDNKKVNVILGINGIGKTTLLNIMAGRLIPDSGNIQIDDFEKINIAAKKQVFFLSDEKDCFNNLTGSEYLSFISKLYKGISFDITQNIALLDSLDLISSLGGYIGTYSLGMRQKIQIAAAFLSNANNIIMDEPFNSLDNNMSKVLEDLLNNAISIGKNVIITCHDLERILHLTNEGYLLSSQNELKHIRFDSVDNLASYLREEEVVGV